MLERDSQSEEASKPVLQQLQKWAMECGTLLIATAFSSPKALRDLYHCNFAEATIVKQDLSETFYCSLLVGLALSIRAVVYLLYCCVRTILLCNHYTVLLCSTLDCTHALSAGVLYRMLCAA